MKNTIKKLLREHSDNNEFAKRLSKNYKKIQKAAPKAERKVVFDYLDELQKTSVVNMFQAPTFLTSGKRWVEAYVGLHGLDDKETDFSYVINNADRVRDALIRICMNEYYNSPQAQAQAANNDDDDESEPSIVSYVNRMIHRKADELWRIWTEIYGHEVINLRENANFTCSNCGHSWDLEDSDPQPYTCHNCGTNNATGS